MLLGFVDATLTRPWSQQVGLLSGGDDMMDEDETSSGKWDTGQVPTVTDEPRSQRRCKQCQMVDTELDTILIEQHEASNQLSNDRIDANPERRVIAQTGKRDTTQAPTSQKILSCSRKRLAGDPCFLWLVLSRMRREIIITWNCCNEWHHTVEHWRINIFKNCQGR